MIHPGVEVRRTCVTANGLSVTQAAQILGVDRRTLSNLLNGRSGISAEMAVRLEKVFGTSAKGWMQRQLEYDYAQVMLRAAKITLEPFSAADTEEKGK
ncbi:HigA family addiction module antitoxin [Roseobacter sp. TSBP12]|uniref:HigA family addiction module antitoxin n=1 Tax=Roseobacter sp. TSBP12 TaxID=1236613 RepID=UPI00125EEC76|nr:HigA family addiction module antitoxin [Roseobacter sp. TSBP12]KAB6714674.1 addiction module antidote protein, HigA family [Roseobacter sp. TSBP12]